MLDLENVPEHIRDWFERDLLPEVEADKARILALIGAAQAQGKTASAVVAAFEQIVSLVDPAAAPAVETAVDAVRTAAAEGKRILEDALGKM